MLDPEIVDVDPVSPGSFMRQQAITGMEAFWEAVDSAAKPDDVFEVTGRRKMAKIIRENYGDILPG